jgi:four helix bundle protein
MQSGFEKRDCWMAATEVRRKIQMLARRFPLKEENELALAMIRNARSMTQNIATGCGLHQSESLDQFMTSRKNMFTLMDQLITARDEGYLSSTEYETSRLMIEAALVKLNDQIDQQQVLISRLSGKGKSLPLTINF